MAAICDGMLHKLVWQLLPLRFPPTEAIRVLSVDLQRFRCLRARVVPVNDQDVGRRGQCPRAAQPRKDCRSQQRLSLAAEIVARSRDCRSQPGRTRGPCRKASLRSARGMDCYGRRYPGSVAGHRLVECVTSFGSKCWAAPPVVSIPVISALVRLSSQKDKQLTPLFSKEPRYPDRLRDCGQGLEAKLPAVRPRNRRAAVASSVAGLQPRNAVLRGTCLRMLVTSLSAVYSSLMQIQLCNAQ